MSERNVERVSLRELSARMDDSVWPQIRQLMARPGFQGFVLYRNEMFDSSSFGEEKLMACGEEGHFSNTLAKALVGRLGDLPSRMMLPVWHYDKEFPNG